MARTRACKPARASMRCLVCLLACRANAPQAAFLSGLFWCIMPCLIQDCAQLRILSSSPWSSQARLGCAEAGMPRYGFSCLGSHRLDGLVVHKVLRHHLDSIASASFQLVYGCKPGTLQPRCPRFKRTAMSTLPCLTLPCLALQLLEALEPAWAKQAAIMLELEGQGCPVIPEAATAGVPGATVAAAHEAAVAGRQPDWAARPRMALRAALWGFDKLGVGISEEAYRCGA